VIQKNTWKTVFFPSCAFLAVFALHFLWLGLFPEENPAQSQWVLLPVEEPWLVIYQESGSYWLGYSYGLCAAFIVYAFRRYLLGRCRTSARFAVGGLTLTGGLAVAGCFLIGCCGSPMLIVWINLFGAGFLPLAKPLVATITTVSVGVAWFWLQRREAMMG